MIFLLSKDMIYGDSSGLYLKPLPRYGFMRVPEKIPFKNINETVNKITFKTYLGAS